MKILFDIECTQPSLGSKRHGGGIYGEIVLKKLIDHQAEVVVYYNSAKWLNPEIKSLCEQSVNIELVDRNGRSLEDIFEQYSCKRLFSPLPGKEYNEFEKEKTGVIHGLRALELEHDKYCMKYPLKGIRFKLRIILERLFSTYMKNRHKTDYQEVINGGDFVVVSNHTASALKVWFPEVKDREIGVFYSPSTVSDAKVENYSISESYLLMVSGNRWEKNTIRAIEAIEKLYDNGLLEDVNVYITGLKDFKELKHKLKYPNRFKALGYVDDDVLRSLYKSAYAFIYPSINEGFGYPPLEAMHYGVPVAASAVCSIPEVCGDAVLYFNPFDINEIANRILQLMDKDTHKRLAEAGLKRAAFIRAKQDEDLERLCRYITC